jgi:hypothetical protein
MWCRIEVNNTTGQAAMGTFRIFMAPTADERGQPLRFEDQRRLMCELDKFSQPCQYLFFSLFYNVSVM